MPLSTREITFNSEVTEVSSNISIISDNIEEGNETFVVGVFDFGGDFSFDVILPEDSLVVIIDDDVSTFSK